MRVTATLKGKPDSQNRRTIYIRVNDGSERKFEATRLRVTKGQFKKGKVVDHPHAAEYNLTIKKKIAAKELEYGQSPVSDKIQEISFHKYCLNAISEWEKRKEKKASTLRQHMGELTKIKGYRPNFNLSALTKHFLEGYLGYCLSDLDNKKSTALKTFKFLRMICAKAVRERKLKEDPFLNFKMPKYKDPKKRFLTREQINTIETIALSDELRFIANWFLICCYTGLRFGDAAAFDRSKHIKSGRLVVYTGKTGEVVGMPIAGKVQGLLEQVHYKPMPFTNQYCNRAIKTIRKKADIKEHVTWHTSRHSFGTLAASSGISQEVTAKLMGHADLKTTAVYYKITNPRIDAEVGKMFE